MLVSLPLDVVVHLSAATCILKVLWPMQTWSWRDARFSLFITMMTMAYWYAWKINLYGLSFPNGHIALVPQFEPVKSVHAVRADEVIGLYRVIMLSCIGNAATL